MPIVNSELSIREHDKEKADIIRVVLADDHPIVRTALRNELAKETDFKVVAEAGDGEEAVRLVAELHPDIVVMDIGMPKLNGIEATRQVKATASNTIVLVLTVYDDIEHVLGILESGADGYLIKSVAVDEIIQSMRLIVSGETVLSPQVFHRVLKYALRNVTKPLPINIEVKLSSRELAVLRLVARGMSNKEIAAELNISSRTVKSHMVDIFYKLNLSSRIEAVIVGLRSGLLKQEDLG
jgi:DNA-binding NarL/FixJ family response regulator